MFNFIPSIFLMIWKQMLYLNCTHIYLKSIQTFGLLQWSLDLTLSDLPWVYGNMFSVKPRASLCLVFFTVLIQNSEKQWKVLSGCLKNLPLSIPSGHQTLPWGCTLRESLMTFGNSLGQIFPDNHCGLSTVYTKDVGVW